MDPTSSFLLAAYSSSLKRADIFESLLVYGANKSHKYSMSSLAMHYVGMEENNVKAFYWFTRYSIEHGDMVALVMVAEFLLSNNNDGKSPFLCENLLIDLAKRGIGQAFLYLGVLHLDDSKGFKNDPSLAIKYFTVAHQQFQNPKATQYLGHCYLSGIGVEQNIERGSDLLKAAGVDPTPFLEKLKSRPHPNEQTETPAIPKEDTDLQVDKEVRLVDKLVASALTISGVVAAIFMVKKMVERRK